MGLCNGSLSRSVHARVSREIKSTTLPALWSQTVTLVCTLKSSFMLCLIKNKGKKEREDEEDIAPVHVTHTHGCVQLILFVDSHHS